jgi:hypothetical protein
MHVAAMMKTHPRPIGRPEDAFAGCIEACHDCSATCLICADACLSEEMIEELRACIRLDLDCADICRATAAVLSRQAQGTFRELLAACIAACRRCGDECAKHASHHAHCRICAEVCRACAQSCEHALGMPI